MNKGKTVSETVKYLMESLQYVVLPGNPESHFEETALYNDAYQFWRSYWQTSNEQIGESHKEVYSDDFSRHDFVNVLVHNGSVIAMINSTALDLRFAATPDHSYLKQYFGQDFLKILDKLGVQRFLTQENIVVSKDWRSSQLGLSLGGVVLALGLKNSIEYGFDGAIGAARADAPTAKLSYLLGAQPILTDLKFHGVPTDLVAWRQNDIRSHPDNLINRLIESLWEQRTDSLLGAIPNISAA